MTQVAFYLCVSYQPAGEYEKLVDIASPIIDLLEETKREEEFYAEVNIYSGLCGYYGMGSFIFINYSGAGRYLITMLAPSNDLPDCRHIVQPRYYEMFLCGEF